MKAIFMTLMIAMTPVFELRAAIPFAVVSGMSIKSAFIISVIGNMLPVPILVIFTRKVFEWLRQKSEHLNKFVIRMEEKAEKNKALVEKSTFWGLLLLVAIPLPGTGAWTGSLVAAMLDMRLKRSLPAICAGVIIAGIIITTITYGTKAFML